jgi:hypothetical protein
MFTEPVTSQPPKIVPQEFLEHIAKERAKKQELEERGIYINLVPTITFKGKKLMAMGNQVIMDGNENTTFHEMILRELQRTLGKKWWDAESAKPPEQQHFIRKCYTEVSKPIGKDQDLKQEGENVRSFLPNGYVQSLMSLAFDVYVLKHKDSFPAGWLKRLRTYDQYQGVRYEIAVASIFARIDCRLEFYNDNKTDGKHPEFIATHELSGNKLVVEAKSRHRQGVIHTAGSLDPEKAMLGDVDNLFTDALTKNTDGMPYIIFIDVNAPTDTDATTIESKWFADVKEMVESTTSPSAEKPEKYNALVVTNYSPHYEGLKVAPTGGYSIIANTHIEHPMADGVDGNFTYRLMQAAASYGFVPNL